MGFNSAFKGLIVTISLHNVISSSKKIYIKIDEHITE